MAFSECYSLSQITIPASVKSIENGAFFNCSSLTQITIPSSVTRIESGAFQGCNRLKQVTFADTSGWYFDARFTKKVGAAELASSLQAGMPLYKKSR